MRGAGKPAFPIDGRNPAFRQRRHGHKRQYRGKQELARCCLCQSRLLRWWHEETRLNGRVCHVQNAKDKWRQVLQFSRLIAASISDKWRWLVSVLKLARAF